MTRTRACPSSPACQSMRTSTSDPRRQGPPLHVAHQAGDLQSLKPGEHLGERTLLNIEAIVSHLRLQ